MKNLKNFTINEIVNFVFNNDFDKIHVENIKDSKIIEMYIYKYTYEDDKMDVIEIQTREKGNIYKYIDSSWFFVDTDDITSLREYDEESFFKLSKKNMIDFFKQF